MYWEDQTAVRIFYSRNICPTKTGEFLAQHSDYELVKLDYPATSYLTQGRTIITL